MQRLTGLDSAFLALETPRSTGHVGGLSILDPSTAPERLDLARLTEVIGERLPLVPVMRRRLHHVPFGLDQPYWVDDEHFDIEYHVREIALPRPGSDAQLCEQVSRLHARPLDRSRPLWESYLITGLAKKRVALYTKVHHAAIDGVSGAELLTVLMDLSPQGRPVPPSEPFDPASAPSRLELGVRAIARLALRPVQATKLATDALRALPALAPALAPVVSGLVGRGRSADGEVIRGAPLIAPTTPLNTQITAHRKFAFISLPLAEVKTVKNAFGVSVNDVVMAMCAGALRRWLLERNALPSAPLVAMVPVSIRDASGKGAMGNKVSAMLAVLPTHIADPVERLASAHQATQIAKAQQAVIPQGLIDDITDFAPPALTARAARVVLSSSILSRLPPFNVVVSNVPGPNVPVYLAGAKLLAHYPLSVVLDGQGMNVTLIGYLGQLHFGLVAAREVMPDIDVVAQSLRTELDHLLKAAHSMTAG
ncbi:MAG: wax ester/triacylglycerol synthase family O-acyltransferase [Nostocoides sp.]